MHCHLRGVPAAYKSPKSQGVNYQNLADIYWEELHRLTGLSHHMFLLKLSTQEIDRVSENGYPCKPPSFRLRLHSLLMENSFLSAEEPPGRTRFPYWSATPENETKQQRRKKRNTSK
ncbi:hypothetical protein DY000_02053777 [Brassica cretica]|uniref:Uncharacterized protein n=1 Tax=Brassica cretica TaxID=69181 RepID=A0ABQ7AL99_BRACR|nr:hypothetical protein DY000_02053777 [Brassica cretica]